MSSDWDVADERSPRRDGGSAMLRSLNALLGFTIAATDGDIGGGRGRLLREATDGDIGHVDDFLVEDSS
jgi:hypothetical protein